MEKYTKRLLSLALVAVMVFSMLPDFSFAASAQTETQSQTDISSLPADAQTAIQNAASYSQYAKDNLKFTGRDSVTARCPFCNAEATWEPITAAKAFAAAGGHYYLAEDITANADAIKTTWRTSDATVAASTKVCLNLNGKNVTTTTGAALYISHGGTYNVFDPYAGTDDASVLTGNGANYYSAGSLFVGNATSAPVVNLYGGIFRKSQVATGNDIGEPVVYLNNTGNIVNMFEGTVIDGSNCNFFNSQTYPAAVTMMGAAGKTCQFNMYGGEITGSDLVCESNEAYTGGRAVCIYAQNADAAGQFTMYAGTITGGKVGANYVGASVYIKKGAVFTMEGGKIGGGIRNTTTEDIYVEDGGTLTNNTYVDAIDAVRFANSSYSYSAKCRHCNTAKTWTLMSGALAGNCVADTHYLMTANVADTAQYSLMDVNSSAAKTVCWSLNGKTVHTGRSVRAYNSGATLNIMGSGEVIGVDGSSAATYAVGTIVAQWGGKLNLYGGTYSTNNGKPVLYVQGGACNVTVHEGVVFKDNAGTATNLVNVTHDTPITLDGVTVNGHINMGAASTKLVLSGKTAIDQLTLVTGSTVDVSGLTAGADIKVTAPDGVFTKAVPADKAQTIAGYFSIYGNDATKQIAVTEDSELEVAAVSQSGPKGGYNDPLVFGTDGLAWCPVCQRYETWTELSDESASAITAGGHYYLTGDYTYTGTGTAFNPQAASCLHLGDKTFSAPSGIAVSTSTNLNIMGTGTITTGKDTNWQGTLYIAGGTTKILGDVTITKASTALQTAILFAYNTGRIDIEGDVTIGTAGLTYSSAGCSAITLRGNGTNAPVVNMKNGTVIGGENTAGTYGSCVTWHTAPGTFNMTGGELTTTSTNDAVIYIGSNQTAIIGANATLTGAKAMLAYSGAPSVTISGTVTGSVDLRGGGAITLTGTPAIGELKLPANPNITATGMTGVKNSGTIKLNTTGTVGTFTNAEAAKSWFTLDSSLSEYAISVSGNTLKIAEARGAETSVTEQLDFVGSKAWCPVCKTHGNVWTQVTNGMTISAAGHYYLNSDDITNVTIANNGSAVGKVCLHLNDHNITNSSGTAITVNDACELNVMGTGTVSGTGVIDGSSKIAASIHVSATSSEAVTINLHSGTYDKTGSVATYGIYSNYATLNLIECTVLDNSATATYMIQATGGDINVKSGATVRATAANKYTLNQWGTASSVITVEGTVYGAIQVQGGFVLKGEPNVNYVTYTGTVWSVDATGLTGGSVKVNIQGTFSTAFGTGDAGKAAAVAAIAYLLPINANYEIVAVETGSGWCLAQQERKGNETSVTERLDFVGNKAYCPVCGDYFDWEVTSGGTISKGGHYYLNTSITSAITVSATDKVCLHLNGNDVTAASAAAITVSGACSGLHIMGTADSAVSGKAGGWEGSALNVKANATVYMYAGTYTKNAADVAGPIVELTGAGGTVYMYAPAVIDARNLSASNLAPALAIRGASATPGKFVMEGGTIYGGTQTHAGTRRSAAVTVYDSYSTFQMKGGDLYAGNVTNDNLNSDAIGFQSGGTLIIEDGATVHAGTGYSIVVDIAADVSIAGTVAGTVYITNNGKNANMTLSGAAKVGKLSIPAGMLIEVSDLSEGADVKVDAFGTFTKAISTDAEAIVNNEWITSAYPTYEDVAADVATLKINYIGSTDATDTLTFYDGINKAYCSGCGKLACWTALSKTGETTYLADGDHYYVPAGGFAHAGTGRVIGITTAGRVGCLHMNGENITTTNNAGGILVSGAGTTLNIMGQGTITGSGQYTYTGAALQVQTESACNLYGKVTLTKTDTVAPVVLLLTGGHLTMNDQVVIGATGLTYGAAAAVSIRAVNGNVDIGSTLTMNGGTVYGGNASNGASAIFFVDTASGDLNTLDMQGGELVGDPSSTDDSTIYAAGAFNLYIGEDAEVGATGAGKSFDSAWVSNATQMTIAGTVNGSVDCTDFTANVQGQPKLVGTAKVAELILDNNNTVDATELAEGAEIYINLDGADKDPHATNIFTSKFESDDAADAVKNCFKPMVDGVYYEGVYGVVVTPANELKVEFILSKDANIVWVDEDAKTGFCPVCQKVVTWKTPVVGSTNWFDDGFHFYIPDGGLNFTAEKDAFNLNQAGGNETGCLHLNGNNLTAARTALAVTYNNIVNVMGTGTISGSGADYWLGSALHTAGADTKINVYGEVTLTKAADNAVAPIIFNNGGTVNIHDNVVIDGRNRTSTNNSAMISLYDAASTFNMYGGTYYAGTLNVTDVEKHSKYNALYAVAGSTFNMQGGTLYAGTAALEGQPHILVNGNNVTIGENALITGSTTGYILNQWDGAGTLTISGHIEGQVQSSQTKDGQFILSGTPEITSLNMAGFDSKVDVSGMTGGNVGLSVAANNLRVFTTEITTGTPATIAGYFTYVGETEDILVIAAEGNYLAVSKASFVVIDASGNEIPVNTVAAAIEYVTTNPGSYIKVTDTVALTLKGEEITLDMNGNTASVSGEGVVTAFDSTTDDFGKTTAGILTAGEKVTVQQDVTANDNRYLYIKHGEGKYSFHRVIIKLTQIVLNTKNSALYYKAQFQSDETLADRVIDFGISYSLYDADKGVGGMPSASNPIASQIDVPMAGEFTGNNAASTSYISNIVTEGSADNATSVEMKICANPFLQVDVTGDDGVQGFGQYSSEDTGKAKSMKDILDYYESDMNNSYTGLSEARKNELDKFYKTMFTDNDIDLGYTLIGSTYAAPAATNDEEEEA